MNWQRRPYFNAVDKVSAGSAYDELNDDRVDEDFLLEVTHVSVENETTGYTHLRIGVYERGVFRVHEEEKNPAAGEVYWTRSKIYVTEGANLRVRCTGCTASDIIRVNIQGFMYKLR